jgi:DNA polymerase-1
LPKLPEPIRSSEHEAREIAHRARLEVITVDDESKLKALEQAIADSSYFAFDTETDSLDSINANLVGLSISTKPGKGYYLPIGHREGEQLAKGRVIEVFNSILSSDKLKIAHNLKFDLEVCETFGLLVAPPYFDTMLAAYLISPGNRAESLSNLSFQEFGEEMQPITELIGKGKGQICFAEVPISEASYYSAEDAEVTFRLYELLSKRLTAEGLAELLETVELPLVPILAQMERRGITVDTSYLGKLSVELEKEIATLEKQIYQLAGTEFNIASPAQLGEILFTRLGLPSAQIKKGKTGYSTAASELDKLKGEHKIIEEIFSYRELVKLKNTYIDALPVLVSAKDGRVHTDFNQAIAATGRLSSSNPNLQNIPNRTEVGRRVRRAFVAGKGNELISADYSQIELRIIAQLAHEKNLIQAFRQGADIHTETAAKVAGISEQKVTREMRYAAKAVNFGLMYGLSAHGLAASTGMSREDAASFIKRYFELYPGIASYIDNTKRQAKEQGFVSTLLGRKRYLPEINSNNFVVRGAAERMAINMPVQGTAADMMKLAMIKIQDTIGDDAGMLLQVHDELVFEVPKGKVRELSKRIKRIMEEALKLEVPIVVDVKSGSSWDEMRAVEL